MAASPRAAPREHDGLPGWAEFDHLHSRRGVGGVLEAELQHLKALWGEAPREGGAGWDLPRGGLGAGELVALRGGFGEPGLPKPRPPFGLLGEGVVQSSFNSQRL